MMSMARGRSSHVERIVKQYFRPLFARIAQLLREGIATGAFRGVEPLQFVPSMIAAIVFYFINAPVMRLMTGEDPLSAERIAARRAAVLDFISAALFMNPAPASKGVRL
jgi:AcrR family transcriptional regulator